MRNASEHVSDSSHSLRLRVMTLVAMLFGVLFATGVANASEAIELPQFSEFSLMMPAIWLVFVSALIGLAFGAKWY
ncbi:MAG TPA: hypothetical protein VGK34_09490, partial [Armatimonadota bacterium]